MKVFRGIISFVLILIIIGGIGFLAWNIMNNSGNMQGMNMSDSQNKTDSTTNMQNNANQNTMPGMQSPTSLDAIDIKNKDNLNQVLTTINDAFNQITIDPYSKITVPRANLQQNMTDQQKNTTINIYPNSNNTVNVPTQGSPPPTPAPIAPNANIVYNQAKLEQLHNGIFKVSQGLMLLNELNDDLTVQVTTQDQANYESYVNRYRTLYQNKVKLSKALNLVNEGSFLVNVNPYTSGVGYEYDVAQMEQLNKGIYKLAQGMFLGVRLGEDFTKQMTEISSLANNTSMNNMNMAPSFSIGNIDVRLILYILIFVFILTFIIAFFGAVRAAYRPAK
jgi:hypothetical protein